MLAHGIGMHAAKHMLHHLCNKYDLNHKEEAKLKEMIKEFLSDDGKIDKHEKKMLNDYAKAMGQDGSDGPDRQHHRRHNPFHGQQNKLMHMLMSMLMQMFRARA